MKKAIQLIFAAMIFAGAAMAQTSYMINVMIEEEGEGGAMNLTLPLEMVKSIGPAVTEALADADFQIQEGDLQGLDIKAMWNEFRNVDNHEWAEINHEGMRITIRSENDMFIIKGDGIDDEDVETINIKFPLALGDALFSDSEEIDMDSVVETLKGFVGQDLVNITGNNKVRIWISN